MKVRVTKGQGHLADSVLPLAPGLSHSIPSVTVLPAAVTWRELVEVVKVGRHRGEYWTVCGLQHSWGTRTRCHHP